MNVVIYGFGNIGKYYLKILKKNNKIKKIFVADKFISKKRIYKNVIFINNKNLNINTADIKYAFICTPSNLHYDNAKFFLKNKINVLIEKPFVLKYEDAKKLIQIAKKNKVRCWTVFQNRCNKTIYLLKKLIEKKYFGKIELVLCNLIWSRNKKYYLDNWHGKYSSDGGVLTNQAIHLLDILIYLFGEINFFSGNMDFNRKKLQAEDYINLYFKLKNDINASLIATTRANKDYEMSIDVIGSKERLQIKGMALNKIEVFNNKFVNKYNKYSYDVNYGFGNTHKDIIENFINHKSIDRFNFSIEKNVYIIKVIHSIYNNLLNNSVKFKIKSTKSILGQ